VEKIRWFFVQPPKIPVSLLRPAYTTFLSRVTTTTLCYQNPNQSVPCINLTPQKSRPAGSKVKSHWSLRNLGPFSFRMRILNWIISQTWRPRGISTKISWRSCKKRYRFSQLNIKFCLAELRLMRILQDKKYREQSLAAAHSHIKQPRTFLGRALKVYLNTPYKLTKWMRLQAHPKTMRQGYHQRLLTSMTNCWLLKLTKMASNNWMEP
jgi:hypothetical protein